MRAACLVVLALGSSACATAPPPAPTPPPQHAAEPEPEPEPVAVAPVPEPAPTPEVTPDPPSEPEPAFEPFTLNDQQLARARKVQPLVAAAASEFDLDPNVINGIIWAESKFNPKARNRSGAKGLMQLMPITARGMAKKLDQRARPYDPEFSIRAGSKLLSIMMERFDGDLELALFAYARGGGKVRGWIANGETQMPQGVIKFIAKVRRGQQTFEALGFPGLDEQPRAS